MDEVPVAGGGHMGDEGPSAVTVGVIIHHITSVSLAQESRRTRAPLYVHTTPQDFINLWPGVLATRAIIVILVLWISTRTVRVVTAAF